MPALKNLRHEAFAQGPARGMSASAAYVEAGYKASGCTGLKVLRLIEETMETDELPENDERLQKPEIKRDEMGRFEQAGTGLIKKKQNNKSLSDPFVKGSRGGPRAGAGRPKGSQNKVTKALRDMILGALDRVGGEEYLARLAIENSSAFASLVAKVLPSTLQASESDGGSKAITFTRIIVMPDGQRYVEGVTPKQLPAPMVTKINSSRRP